MRHRGQNSHPICSDQSFSKSNIRQGSQRLEINEQTKISMKDNRLGVYMCLSNKDYRESKQYFVPWNGKARMNLLQIMKVILFIS
jgi:hypothetical protein